MKQSFKILALAAISTLWGCKPKETTLLTTKDWLIGSWKLQMQGLDLNNNTKFEIDEKNSVADSAKFTFQILENGKGFKIGPNNSSVDTMEWVLYNYETTLHFKIFNQGFVNNQYFKFETGTKTLILLDSTVSPGFFRYFERQN